jgi:hypothetical protein
MPHNKHILRPRPVLYEPLKRSARVRDQAYLTRGARAVCEAPVVDRKHVCAQAAGVGLVLLHAGGERACATVAVQKEHSRVRGECGTDVVRRCGGDGGQGLIVRVGEEEPCAEGLVVGLQFEVVCPVGCIRNEVRRMPRKYVSFLQSSEHV